MSSSLSFSPLVIRQLSVDFVDADDIDVVDVDVVDVVDVVVLDGDCKEGFVDVRETKGGIQMFWFMGNTSTCRATIRAYNPNWYCEHISGTPGRQSF